MHRTDTSSQHEVAELERAVWQAAIDRRFDFIATQFSDDYVGTYTPGGRMTKAEVLGSVDRLRVDAAHLEDLEVISLAPGVILLRYTLHARGVYDGLPDVCRSYGDHNWPGLGDDPDATKPPSDDRTST